MKTFLQEMADAKQALAEEVATKHDQVMLLKKDLQMMEEKCLQIAFKEDIIRELRRELKQLKQQVSDIVATIIISVLRPKLSGVNS